MIGQIKSHLLHLMISFYQGRLDMKIIISPAKRMKDDIAYLLPQSKPVYLRESRQLLKLMKQMDVKQIKRMLQCSDKIAKDSYEAYHHMKLSSIGVPAILAYDGIQYKYMAPHIFSEEQFSYVQNHVFILSGFYGVLRALDGVIPYRLELDNSFFSDQFNNLYTFWKDKPYQFISKDCDVILDLASVQYGKIIKRYIKEGQHYVKCSFMEICDNGYKEKGVYVKMARGAMVRYLAENNVTTLDQVKQFHELGYQYQNELSDENHYVFTRKL